MARCIKVCKSYLKCDKSNQIFFSLLCIFFFVTEMRGRGQGGFRGGYFDGEGNYKVQHKNQSIYGIIQVWI